ncbi:MAG: benzoyl-CoA-dihydrodiol lyase [Ectothiorhodospiraceae bacterium AqS1]|nr:benzoyl-CoA-dihydrodiol lyase [Ectothiorhodospiraceae bacterium AqS1]
MERSPIDIRTSPDRYRHWRLEVRGEIATLTLDVDENAGIVPGHPLKRNSYDLGVDIELADAVQRLRFERPEVAAVIITSGKERIFSAGANIRMLAAISHEDKVNFCKFTNETRCAIEDASETSGQRYLAALNGSAAGGGYELALAADWILLIDDGASAVSLPEVPLLGVLPATGGLIRLLDKRRLRRDRADIFCTTEEGMRGQRALDWRLVDEIAPASRFSEAVEAKARDLADMAAASGKAPSAGGIRLHRVEREFDGEDILRYACVDARIERERRIAHLTIKGPKEAPPANAEDAIRQGDAFWPLALARELDDLILHLRHNEREIGTLALRSCGSLERVLAYDHLLARQPDSNWFIREVKGLWKRALKRLESSSRSLIALIEPGSCFAGFLLEPALASDRSYMLDDEPSERKTTDADGCALLCLGETNFGAFPMANGLLRIEARYPEAPQAIADIRRLIGVPMGAKESEAHRLVSLIPDDIDWEDEIRLALEERAGFSPDALTGMESTLRCPGRETMESRIFGRLSAWQNWIFQRPNAGGKEGALSLYGSGARPTFNRGRA